MEVSEGGALQVWDFPIRRPWAKILGYAALATVLTVLVVQALGRLRRGRARPA